MGKFTNGPDWTDIAMYLGALDELHECKAGVLITTAGEARNGALRVTLMARFAVVPGSALPEEVVVEGGWPCAESHSLEAHVYEGIYRLDFAIGEAYQQRFLPGTTE